MKHVIILSAITSVLLAFAIPAKSDVLPPCKGLTVWEAPHSSSSLAKGWPIRNEDQSNWRTQQAQIVDGTVAVTFPAGSINPGNSSAPQGGLGFSDHRPPQRAGCLSYELRFQSDFVFAKGGKLPGLFGGRDYSGCTSETERGFSTRMMWGNNGTFFLYAYFADRASVCGEVQGSGIAYAARGKWHHVEQRIRMNTPGQDDGMISVLIDGKEIVTLTNRKISSGQPIDGLAFETFFGGSNPEWASPLTQSISFRKFKFVLP